VTPKTPPAEATPDSPDGAPVPTTRPTRIPEKTMPLGPRLSTIFGSIAFLALGTWLALRPPQRIPVTSFPKYVAFEANIEQGSPLDCRSRGCLLIIVGTDLRGQGSIESAMELARALVDRGIETQFVITGAPMKECAATARLFRRPVLLDPDGTLMKALRISQLPYWIVHESSGKILRRGEEPLTEGEIAREAGL
jgi:hypothetical protein